MKNTVFRKGPAQFTPWGESRGQVLHETEEQISPGLCARLHAYAANRLEERGLAGVVEGWTVEIYTMDAEDPPAHRWYNVRWTNPQGAEIELCQIACRDGWPHQDHGFEIDA